MNERSRRIVILLVALVAIGLNIATFASAYPQMFMTTNTKARDFSAYYIGAWRLFFNPSKIYSGVVPKGDYPILPKPSTYRYAPSFLLFASPFLVLPYQNAMIVFNLFQLFLLPVMALMVYRILQGRNIALVSAVMVVVLLQPLPGLTNFFQTWRVHEILSLIDNYTVSGLKDTFSWSYYYNWIDGNAKVLTTFLLLGCFYFGRLLRPYSSGFFLGLSFFDPRFFLVSIPLAVVLNRAALHAFATGTIATAIASNFLVLYHSIGLAYLRSLSYPTGFYAYSWIPFYTVVALTLANYRQLASSISEGIDSLRLRLGVRGGRTITVGRSIASAAGYHSDRLLSMEDS